MGKLNAEGSKLSTLPIFLSISHICMYISSMLVFKKKQYRSLEASETLLKNHHRFEHNTISILYSIWGEISFCPLSLSMLLLSFAYQFIFIPLKEIQSEYSLFFLLLDRLLITSRKERERLIYTRSFFFSPPFSPFVTTFYI